MEGSRPRRSAVVALGRRATTCASSERREPSSSLTLVRPSPPWPSTRASASAPFTGATRTRRTCCDSYAPTASGATPPPPRRLADTGPPGEAFAEFMRRVVDANTHALTLRLAERFSVGGRVARRSGSGTGAHREAGRAGAAGRAPSRRTDSGGPLVRLRAVGRRPGRRRRADERAAPYLALQLDALHGSRTSELPGRAPSWRKISRHWAR